MKVTALIPDSLIRKVQKQAKGQNLTESLITALTEWVSISQIRELNSEIEKTPLTFKKGFDAKNLRAVNRRAI